MSAEKSRRVRSVTRGRIVCVSRALRLRAFRLTCHGIDVGWRKVVSDRLANRPREAAKTYALIGSWNTAATRWYPPALRGAA